MSIITTIQSLLSPIKDPETGFTLSDLHISLKITEHGQTIDIKLQSGFPCEGLRKTFIPLLQQSLSHSFPDKQCHVSLEWFVQAHRTQLAGKGLRGIKNTIAIASGKGGVGKSTVTVNLAYALAQEGARVGILDADIYGPSIPTMLGKGDPVQVQDDHYLPVNAHGLQAMSIGYLTEGDSALIWRGPMLAKALIQMLDLTLWDNLDYLFIDLPPGTGDIQLSLVQKIPLTSAIIVTTPQTVATMDAQKALQMFGTTNIDVLGIVENMALHTCSQCGHQEALFGKGGAQQLCQTTSTQFLGQLPLHPTIGEASDLGYPVNNGGVALAFRRIALKAGAELAQHPLNYSGKFPPIVVE